MGVSAWSKEALVELATLNNYGLLGQAFFLNTQVGHQAKSTTCTIKMQVSRNSIIFLLYALQVFAFIGSNSDCENNATVLNTVRKG